MLPLPRLRRWGFTAPMGLSLAHDGCERCSLERNSTQRSEKVPEVRYEAGTGGTRALANARSWRLACRLALERQHGEQPRQLKDTLNVLGAGHQAELRFMPRAHFLGNDHDVQTGCIDEGELA